MKTNISAYSIIAILLISCNYLLADISSEELFHSEMHKLPNFKQANINGTIVYTYSHDRTNQSFQLNFKDGILTDGFYFSLNSLPPSNEFKKIAKPLFIAVGFNPNNTKEVQLFSNQINKRGKQNDNFRVGNYIITVQTGPSKDGVYYNLRFQRI
jgi:hypothetical protein